MRVAALYDIHGNLPALGAVLADVRAAGVDAVVVGGDVLPGPMPSETLACLTDLPWSVHFLRGNGDRVVAACLAGGDITEVPPAFRDSIVWTAEQLEAQQRLLVASWPATVERELPGLGRTIFCHATPRSDVECLTRTTLEARALPAFAGVAADTVICGHTHMQFDRLIRQYRVVNAGSVGAPFAGPPGAYWLLLTDGVHLRRTTYDVSTAAAALRRSGFPHVEELAVRYVINPPAEHESLRMFAAAELGD